MHIPQFQKLLVTPQPNQIIASFYFDPKITFIKGVCKTPYVDCVTKINGTISNNEIPINFIAVAKFRVSLSESGIEALVSNINICEIIIVGKYAVPPTSCGDFKLYYNVTDPDLYSSGEILDNNDELIVYQVLSTTMENAVLTVLPDKVSVEFIFQMVTEPHLTFIEGGVNIGSTDACSKNFDKYSITGCKKCPVPAPPCPFPSIKKLISILLQILLWSIILSILDPCCKYLPPWFCGIKKSFVKLLMPPKD
jgi:hypothetical protein